MLEITRDELKSMTVVKKDGAAWDVRFRLQNGTEYLLWGDYPSTMATAEAALEVKKSDMARHGMICFKVAA